MALWLVAGNVKGGSERSNLKPAPTGSSLRQGTTAPAGKPVPPSPHSNSEGGRRAPMTDTAAPQLADSPRATRPKQRHGKPPAPAVNDPAESPSPTIAPDKPLAATTPASQGEGETLQVVSAANPAPSESAQEKQPPRENLESENCEHCLSDIAALKKHLAEIQLELSALEAKLQQFRPGKAAPALSETSEPATTEAVAGQSSALVESPRVGNPSFFDHALRLGRGLREWTCSGVVCNERMVDLAWFNAIVIVGIIVLWWPGKYLVRLGRKHLPSAYRRLMPRSANPDAQKRRGIEKPSTAPRRFERVLASSSEEAEELSSFNESRPFSLEPEELKTVVPGFLNLMGIGSDLPPTEKSSGAEPENPPSTDSPFAKPDQVKLDFGDGKPRRR